jgi:hypothetical protein
VQNRYDGVLLAKCCAIQEKIRFDPGAAFTIIDQPLPACLSSDHFACMMDWVSLNYLPNDILVRVDRAGIAVGMEIHVPSSITTWLM